MRMSQAAMPANRIAELKGRILSERPRTRSKAMVARQIAAAARRLTVADVSSIRQGEDAIGRKDQKNCHGQGLFGPIFTLER